MADKIQEFKFCNGYRTRIFVKLFSYTIFIANFILPALGMAKPTNRQQVTKGYW